LLLYIEIFFIHLKKINSNKAVTKETNMFAELLIKQLSQPNKGSNLNIRGIRRNKERYNIH